MRKGVGFLFLSLVALLVALPGSTDAGDCAGYAGSYYGRTAYYYPATYYSPPAYQAPCQQTGTCANQYTPNPYNIDTLFKVAPELAYGRINDEVATKAAKSAVEQFKAEIQAQEATRQREADRARQERLLVTMEQSLNQQSALLQQLLSGGQSVPQPAATDPEKARMAEEIRQLRAYLEQMQSPPNNARPTNPAPTLPPLPPTPIPPAKQPAPKGNDPVSVIQTAINSSCLDCHGGTRAGRMNLTNVATLNRGQLSEIQRRLVTPNKKKVMPPPDSGHASPDIAVYNALDELVDRTPFAVTAGN